MGLYLRCIVIPAAFIGWLIYQLVVRKRRLPEMKRDIAAIALFVAVWAAIYYFVFY